MKFLLDQSNFLVQPNLSRNHGRNWENRSSGQKKGEIESSFKGYDINWRPRNRQRSNGPFTLTLADSWSTGTPLKVVSFRFSPSHQGSIVSSQTLLIDGDYIAASCSQPVFFGLWSNIQSQIKTLISLNWLDFDSVWICIFLKNDITASFDLNADFCLRAHLAATRWFFRARRTQTHCNGLR